jgi:hypothetical protein
MESLFGDHSNRYPVHERMALDDTDLRAHKARCLRRLVSALETCADRQAVPIVSAERCLAMTGTELARLRDFFVEHGYSPDVLVYVRPYSHEPGYGRGRRVVEENQLLQRRLSDLGRLGAVDVPRRTAAPGTVSLGAAAPKRGSSP